MKKEKYDRPITFLRRKGIIDKERSKALFSEGIRTVDTFYELLNELYFFHDSSNQGVKDYISKLEGILSIPVEDFYDLGVKIRHYTTREGERRGYIHFWN